jgi:hypothetical protein
MNRHVGIALALFAAGAPSQETAADVAARVRAGGWLEVSKYRRGERGDLESWSTAHTGDPDRGEWLPVLDGSALRLGNLGAIGWFSLFCHGDGDLLAMTDAEFHFGALGLGASDVELRQFLARPAPSFDGMRGRAELLDRVLAIDRLVARGSRGAVVELRHLVDQEALPPLLRAYASRAAAKLAGEGGGPMRMLLDPATARVPAAFDVAIVLEHARLPDLRWLAGFGRRLGALVTTRAIEAAGGTVSPPQCNGGQRMCDVAGAAPFWAAHHWGNARVDQSFVTVQIKADDRMPVALTWNAAGEFEHERWAQASVPDEAKRDNPLLAGSLEVTATSVYASTDKSRGMPRPALTRRYLPAEGTGYAIHAHVPANSKLWPMLTFLEAPPATGAELRVTFGDPGVIVLMVEARDEDAAAQWVAKGKELLATADAEFAEQTALQEAQPKMMALLRQLLKVELSTKDKAAFAVVQLRGVTPASIRELVEEAATSGH